MSESIETHTNESIWLLKHALSSNHQTFTQHLVVPLRLLCPHDTVWKIYWPNLGFIIRQIRSWSATADQLSNFKDSLTLHFLKSARRHPLCLPNRAWDSTNMVQRNITSSFNYRVTPTVFNIVQSLIADWKGKQMCVQLHSTTLKQLPTKAHPKDSRTTLTHTCSTTQLSTTRDACSHLHSMCQQFWVVSSASEVPKSRVTIPQQELTQSCSSTSCLVCTRVKHLLQLCCGMNPKNDFLLSSTHSQKTSTAALKTSKFTPEVRTPAKLLTKSRPHFSGAIH